MTIIINLLALTHSSIYVTVTTILAWTLESIKCNKAIETFKNIVTLNTVYFSFVLFVVESKVHTAFFYSCFLFGLIYNSVPLNLFFTAFVHHEKKKYYFSCIISYLIIWPFFICAIVHLKCAHHASPARYIGFVIISL